MACDFTFKISWQATIFLEPVWFYHFFYEHAVYGEVTAVIFPFSCAASEALESGPSKSIY